MCPYPLRTRPQLEANTPLSANFANWSNTHKMVKYTQTIRREIADELCECA